MASSSWRVRKPVPMSDRDEGRAECRDLWSGDEWLARIVALERAVQRVAAEQLAERQARSDENFRTRVWTGGMHIAGMLTLAGVVVALVSGPADAGHREVIGALASVPFVAAAVVIVWTTWHATRDD